MNDFYFNELNNARKIYLDCNISGNIRYIARKNSFSDFAVKSLSQYGIKEYDVNENTVCKLLVFADLRDENGLTLPASLPQGSRVIFVEILPEYKAFCSSFESLAEGELLPFLKENDIEAFKRLSECENQAKAFIKNDTEAVILRFSDIFGPCADECSHISFDKIINDIFEKNTVEITKADCENIFSVTYIRDAIKAIALSFSTLKSGNIYHVTSFNTSAKEIKEKIHSLFDDTLTLKSEISPVKKKYFALSDLKISSKKFSPVSLSESVLFTVCSSRNIEADIRKNLTQYCGKLDRLKELEIELLREVDRICKKHNINYFITGGTLLGAVRNGKTISWDDDVDIGMLREDYEKFSKIVPGELNEKFVYCSYEQDKNVHYFFDKIRLKGTFFSTKFSNKYKIENGVYLDIFIYDKTSENKKLSKLQLHYIKLVIRMLNIKWTGKADKKLNKYYLSLIIKFFIKFIPFSCIHGLAKHSLTMFKNSKSSKVIDGTGLNINIGSFPLEWVDGCTEIDFEGMKVPAPVGYDNFLRFIYGEDYKNLPPISERNGTHNFPRFDLGEYIVSDNPDGKNYNFNGELFE